MVADMHGRRSRDIVDKAITALLNMEHRGAQGAEPNTGDGAGILLQVPDEFLRAVVDFDLPEPGSYATGIAFLPQSSRDAAAACESVGKIVEAEGLTLLGWRDVPTDDSSLGALARDAMPTFRQVFIGLGERSDGNGSSATPWISSAVRTWCASAPSTSWAPRARARTVPVAKPSTSQAFPARRFVYKGMLTTPQLRAFYLDLQDERLTSALGIVHSRFSTNTFPSWPLAHPFRRVAHNGEINTVTGNENWMRAREALIHTDVFGSLRRRRQDLPGLHPRRLGHRALRRGARTAAPRRAQPAPRRADDDPGGVGAARVDGPRPAGVLRVPLVADGAVGRPGVGLLHRRHRDRRGPRPQRAASVPHLGDRRRPRRHGVRGRRAEPRPVERVVQKMRLQPGRMFLVDTAQGRIVSDEEIKAELAAEPALPGLAGRRSVPPRRPAAG